MDGRKKWGAAASSSVSGLVHLPASAPPLQGGFSSSLLSLLPSLLHLSLPLPFVLTFFFLVFLSMENTTAFVDLVSFPCFSSLVKNRLFLQMFSGILFAL